ncbi:MAG: hypothetical protein ACREEY_07655 [Brevundimonas sp.]
MSGAFFNDEARKQALLKDIRELGPVHAAWLTPAVLEADAGALAADQGLHPTVGHILPLLGVYGHEAGAAAFYEAAIEAIPVGADGADIVQRWFLASWAHPEYGFKAALAETPLLEPAQAIIDLVEESRSAKIAPPRWRQARAALAAALDVSGLDAELADPVLSMAWDLDRTPAASADVVNAWAGPIMMKAHQSGDWTDADGERYGELFADFSQRALAQIDQPRQGDQEQYARYKAILEDLWKAAPDTEALWRRNQVRQSRADAIVAAWRDEARRLFVDCARAAAG